MRNLQKVSAPKVLKDNQEAWLKAYMEDNRDTNKYRYRHPDIKAALTEETGFKCIYCESKIGHNTPGDVEHMTPSSKEPAKHFEWNNITIACTECNRRKNNYNDPALPFLNPYIDNVESMLVHLGPIVSWKAGNSRAEASVRKLELNGYSRRELVNRKIEKLEALNDVLERKAGANGVMLELIEQKLEKMQDREAEYSGMIISAIGHKS